MMEVFPENTADKVFDITTFQIWDYQKPYILQVLETKTIMLKFNITNTDLKANNTLYNPSSRKVAIIDLGAT